MLTGSFSLEERVLRCCFVPQTWGLVVFWRDPQLLHEPILLSLVYRFRLYQLYGCVTCGEHLLRAGGALFLAIALCWDGFWLRGPFSAAAAAASAAQSRPYQ